MKTLSLTSIAVLAVAVSGPAMAQSCPYLNSAQRCLNNPPYIDGRAVPYGGMVSCQSSTPNNVQYDQYWYNGSFKYQCSYPAVPCAAIQQSDPAAYAQFCN